MSPISRERVEKQRRSIRQEVVGATRKRVLLVEGPSDKAAFEILLSRFRPEWAKDWALTETTGKPRLEALLQLEPSWIGIVDRDGWSSDELREVQDRLPNLLVLPRYCLENYLIVPQELWSAFPEPRRRQFAGGYEALKTSIFGLLPRYVRHCALWRVITPLWTGLRSRGFKEDLASESSVEVAQDDQAIRQKLSDWHHFLAPDAIFAAFKQEEEQAARFSPESQLKLAVHGKCFWKEVDLLLNQKIGQKAREDRRNSILRNLPELPSDLEPVLAKLVTGEERNGAEGLEAPQPTAPQPTAAEPRE